jgi:hypothetical protein
MFLTGTTNIQAGNGENFVLDYDALAIVAGTIDQYFADKAVYREVICMYQQASSTATRPQRKNLSYKNGSINSQIIFSTKAGIGAWSLTEVVIKDKDGGELIISDAQIPNLALYDLLITSV